MKPGRVRIAVQLGPQHTTYRAYRDAVLRAEDLGFDVVLNWDHFLPITEPLDGAHFEAWTLLAAIAEQTERVEFGPLVTCMPFRNPDLVADMARTVDHISARGDRPGRLIFGAGAGWAEREFAEYGYEFAPAGERIDALEGDLVRVRARWERLNPPPTRRIPVIIGGSGERKTLRVVARHADVWHSLSPLDDLPRLIGVLQHWCEVEGRDPDEIELSSGYTVRGFGPLREPDGADRLFDLGIRLFTPAVAGPDYDLEPLRPLLAWRDRKNAEMTR